MSHVSIFFQCTWPAYHRRLKLTLVELWTRRCLHIAPLEPPSGPRHPTSTLSLAKRFHYLWIDQFVAAAAVWPCNYDYHQRPSSCIVWFVCCGH